MGSARARWKRPGKSTLQLAKVAKVEQVATGKVIQQCAFVRCVYEKRRAKHKEHCDDTEKTQRDEHWPDWPGEGWNGRDNGTHETQYATKHCRGKKHSNGYAE